METTEKTPKKTKTTKKIKPIFVDKSYKLTRNRAPLTYMLSSKNTKRKPLLYFDEETGVNRALRYARNQRSPFEDEQDGNVILEPIIFDDGFLYVTKENQVLQRFLHLHPENGFNFEEVNLERDASKDLESINWELDALVAARNLDISRAEQIARIGLGLAVNKMTTAEIKRDILLFARRNPQALLDLIEDPMLELQAKVFDFFANDLLKFKSQKDVYYNTSGNKKKMLTVPFGESRDYIVASFLQSDDGIEALKMLEKQ